MKINLVVSAVICLSLFSCGKGESESSVQRAPAPTTVEIDNLSTDGCLNVPTYFQRIQAMNPEMPILEVSTDFDLSARRSIRPNFRKLMAYSTFSLESRPLSQFHEFTSLSQDACSSITFHAADGTEEIYDVKESSTVSLFAQHKDGRSLRYTWLGPQRMEIDMKYFAYDIPCTQGDEVIVRHNRVLDWSQIALSTIHPGNSPFTIEHSYLSAVADAVGVNPSSVYSQDEEGEQIIVVDQARQLQAMRPRDEILSCGNSSSPPPPAPEEGSPAPEEDEVPEESPSQPEGEEEDDDSAAPEYPSPIEV